MFHFYYTLIKANFDCKDIYSDTDSLLYPINRLDVYEGIRQKNQFLQHFDCSKYPQLHPLLSEVTKYIVLKCKDEFGSVPIQEFRALMPKLYTLVATAS